MPASQTRDSGRVAYAEDKFFTGTAVTATGNSSAKTGYGPTKTLRAQLAVTAKSGTTPTLDVIIQDTVDNGTNWNTIGTFTQATTTGAQVINVTTPYADKIRVKYTVGGTTPSFDFGVIIASEADAV